MLAKGCCEHQKHCHVEITDLPELMGLMERNVARNFGDHHHQDKIVSTKVLRWGNPSDIMAVAPVDIVLGADVVASLYDPIALADTIWSLCHDQSKVYISYKSRLDVPHERFEGRFRELFASVIRTRPNSRNRNPNVWILIAQQKRKDVSELPVLITD
mmetsp:Transcript_27436/g.63697  ORF Transcript_27436/g.63697 Transcript_27436/m.63697 type:complete len:158 (+) Transcript_27436:299-772(+)